jgi:hypothetical protein
LKCFEGAQEPSAARPTPLASASAQHSVRSNSNGRTLSTGTRILMYKYLN